MTLSARLRELAGRATPGPWNVETVPTQIGMCHKIMPLKGCFYVDGMQEYSRNDPSFARQNADPELIVALRNALPELLAALELADVLGEPLIADNAMFACLVCTGETHNQGTPFPHAETCKWTAYRSAKDPA